MSYIIPYTVINKWKKLLNKEQLDELLQNISMKDFDTRIDQNYVNNNKPISFKSDLEYTLKLIEYVTSSMNIEKSEKDQIIYIFSHEISELPKKVLDEKSPYVKRILNKYMLISKKYPFNSLKKYKLNKKHMSILPSGE